MNLPTFSLLALGQMLRKSHCVVKSQAWAEELSEDSPTSNHSIQANTRNVALRRGKGSHGRETAGRVVMDSRKTLLSE